MNRRAAPRFRCVTGTKQVRPNRCAQPTRPSWCSMPAHLAASGRTSSSAASTASVISSSRGSSQPHIAGLTRQCTTPGRQGDGGSGTQPPWACSTTSGCSSSSRCSAPRPPETTTARSAWWRWGPERRQLAARSRWPDRVGRRSSAPHQRRSLTC